MSYARYPASSGGGPTPPSILQFLGTAQPGDTIDLNRLVDVPGILATDTLLSVTPMTTTVGSAWFYGVQGDDFGITGVSNNQITIYCDPAITSGLYVIVSVSRS